MATTLTPSRALRRPRRLDLRALLGGSLAVLAFFGTLLAYHGLQASRTVVLVTHNLPAGAVLRTADLRTEAVRLDDQTYAAAVPADAAQTVVGKALAGPAYAQQILVRAQLQARPALHPGQEAFVVPLPADTGAAGHFQPGDDVQLLWTNAKSGTPAQAEVLLDRVRVLDVTYAPATGIVSTQGVPPSRRAASLTLRLTPAQVPLIAAAKVTGVLDAALLPPAGANH
jgi:Flp pilus assembly protein CpaB